jgi:hypothetical protein
MSKDLVVGVAAKLKAAIAHDVEEESTITETS